MILSEQRVFHSFRSKHGQLYHDSERAMPAKYGTLCRSRSTEASGRNARQRREETRFTRGCDAEFEVQPP